MKLIETTAELLPFISGEDGIYKMIERAGRTCYKSTDKMTDDSAKPFVERMIKSKHGAALEHGTVYLEKSSGFYENDNVKYEFNPYSKSKCVSYTGVGEKVYFEGEKYLISTNYRVLIENNWLDDLQYLCTPTEFHEKRYTMRFTCSRAIAQELTRHRTFSFLMESQRYINYSKERHGGEITFIKPVWCPDYDETDWDIFLHSLYTSEECYFKMLQKGFQPQQARDVLPNATKTELIMTGFSSDWKHVMDLRLFGKTGAPHPDMKDLMQKAQMAMQEAGIWEDIMSKPSKFE